MSDLSEDQEWVVAYLLVVDGLAVTMTEMCRNLDISSDRIWKALVFLETRRVILSQWCPPKPRADRRPRSRVYWLNPVVVPRLRSAVERLAGLRGVPGVLD